MLHPRTHSPFSDAISHSASKFFEPAIRVSVKFQHMTDDVYLRHTALERFTDETERGSCSG